MRVIKFEGRNAGGRPRRCFLYRTSGVLTANVQLADTIRASSCLREGLFRNERVGCCHYLPSTEKANSTFPGIPPHITYPEFTKSIPPPIAGPAPSSEPPFASTPLTVL
jgi:hypothetical protein